MSNARLYYSSKLCDISICELTIEELPELLHKRVYILQTLGVLPGLPAREPLSRGSHLNALPGLPAREPLSRESHLGALPGLGLPSPEGHPASCDAGRIAKVALLTKN
jgi:hypothetical protein